ncbi:MAG TPA: flagellar basal body P-ring protein FlgI [Acidobacteriota bacterium]|mgnify:CR=1 FL=1|jgi:flagellar P-ring protein precursor FlgI|nr:flagellar basal body P-ring protein FlgI [Acidobacteriota bacterium]HRR56725.1 flagellar basal body P-ring protein FlgI [Acidobacteriota bacterium]HRV07938.1 flagellar basal body P-ring protein FlgI [Acidobacteriota bacterium]
MRGKALVMIAVLGIGSTGVFAAPSRLKDIARIQGVRPNQLIGYGLVVGLDGTGDSRQTRFTTQTLSNLLQLEGVVVDARSIQVSNTAAVMVTAELPPFARVGGRIDVTVSSIGDADSLQGGVLLMTPLRAANGQVYAVAQGPVSIGGFSARTMTASVQRNQPTAGRVPGGALVEREVGFELADRPALRWILDHDDFTTARRTAEVINAKLGMEAARALDSRTVEVIVPAAYRDRVVEFVAEMENQTLEVDRVAKVVLNEKTGTVVFGGDVKVAPVTIVHGALTVQIGTEFVVSHPEPFSQGRTVVVPEQTVEVTEGAGDMVSIPQGSSIEEVVRALHSIGATPRDILAIIQAIKAAGALQSELEII